MKLVATASFLLLTACASQPPVKAARSLPETPDPAGAKRLSGDWVFANSTRASTVGRFQKRRAASSNSVGRPSSRDRKPRRSPSIPIQWPAPIEFANTQPPPRYGSQFAREVVACADRGDSVAQEILEQGGRDLVYLVRLLIERMRAIQGAAFQVPEVAFAGSILAHVERMRTSIEYALRLRYPDIRILEEPADPVRGALWRAMRGA